MKSPSFRSIIVLGFGAVLINTMPVWIADIARSGTLSETAAGLLGSVVLLTAALSCAGVKSQPVRGLALGAAVLVPFCLIVLAASLTASAIQLLITCVLLGASLGILTARALDEGSHGPGLQLNISRALTVGLLIALLIYLALPLSGLKSLWILSVLSLALSVAAVPMRDPHQVPEGIRGAFWSGFPVLQFPFFVMMGAYWTYIELFAASIAAAGDLSFWLLGSLLTGAAGSFLAGKMAGGSEKAVRDGAFLCAALTGAVSYVAPTFVVLGFSVLANGFFLFLYFPLYLAARGSGERQTDASQRMAAYLLGFACGGAVGAGVLHLAGFAGLAAAIAATGFLGLIRSVIRHPS